ncbi:CocE/NonD family hydrolase [Haladaptatus sp. GCM10025707]|uniref:CocE/NonD family hydrolase n=1 Tax=unclassified Haladaptatus TaxID=2622732 RepID=UPI0023E7FB68|nr:MULTISPECIES: CocE/NonD family hydrolase [unclassified Haladaptatus]
MRERHNLNRRSVLRAAGALAGAGLLSTTSETAFAAEVQDGIETTTGTSEPDYEAAPAYHEYVQTEFEIDGQAEDPKLYGEIIRPRDPETGDLVEDVPVILTYSPYNDLRSPNREAPDTLAPTEDSGESKSTADDATSQYFVPRGYARAMFDLVGTRNSGGKYDYGGIRERKTAAQLVEWFAAQPWTNGKVGMIGGSYDGTTQWAAAIEQPRGLATIVPQVAIDRWYDYAYIEGVRFDTFGTPHLFDFGFSVAPPLDADPEIVETILEHAQPGDRLEHTVESSEFDVLYDEFWDRRDYKAKADQIQCSAYVEGGWLDDNVKHWDSTRMYNALPDDAPKKLVMGQWGHDVNQLPDALDVRHAWFDYWLKGLDTGVMDLPQVDTQINTGRRYQYDAPSFPPEDTPEVAFPLVRSDPDPGELALRGASIPTYEDTLEGIDEATMLSEDGAGETHLLFETDPLADPLRFSGTPVLDLLANTTDDSAHFAILVYERTADGSTELVARGARNAKNRHSLREHSDVPTDRPYRVPVEAIDIDHEIAAGNRLGLAIAADNTDFIREDPDGSGTHEVVLRAPDGTGGTALRLPIIDGAATAGENTTVLPDVDVTRSDDGSVFYGGQTNQVTLDLAVADAPVMLREPVPEGWSVVGGDGTVSDGYVTFAERTQGANVSYFAEAPDDLAATGEYTFGPVEFSPDDGATWVTLSETTDTNAVLGVSET